MHVKALLTGAWTITNGRSRIARVALGLLILMLVVPFASAVVNSDTLPASKDPNYVDRPEAIASLKNHVAYIGEIQDARMAGVIRYIGNISIGNGTVELEQIRDDYLVAASTIPLMQTNDDIAKARDRLTTYSREFSEETKTQMILYKGSSDALQLSTRASVNAADADIIRHNGSLWLASESARLTVFNQDSVKRTKMITTLANHSTDTGMIRNLSEQIDAQRPGLEKALTTKSFESLETTNEKIRVLTKEYRDTVQKARAAWELQTKLDAMMAMG